MNKPLCLILEDAEKEITTAVESVAKKNGLPCYLLEPIVAVILGRLQNGKRTELEDARRKLEVESNE